MSNVPTLPEHGPLKTRVEDLLELLGRPHMLGVLYTISHILKPPVRFGEISKVAKTSPTTLSARLKEAVQAGLLVRRTYDEIPPRVEYSPTAKLLALDPALMHLNQWCRSHALDASEGQATEAPAEFEGRAGPRPPADSS